MQPICSSGRRTKRAHSTGEGSSTSLSSQRCFSPSTARYDRFTKRRLYQEARVPTYWIVDPEAAQAELWTPNAPFPTVERDVLEWHPVGAEAPFRLSIEELLKPL